MGMFVSDSLQHEDPRTGGCAELGRWEFMVTVAPLRIVGGTGAARSTPSRSVMRGRADHRRRHRHRRGDRAAPWLPGVQVAIARAARGAAGGGRRTHRTARSSGIAADLEPARRPGPGWWRRWPSGSSRLDVLVNNAAVIRNHPIAEYSLDEIDQHLAGQLRAPFLLHPGGATRTSPRRRPRGDRSTSARRLAPSSEDGPVALRHDQGGARLPHPVHTRASWRRWASASTASLPAPSTRRSTRRGPTTSTRPIAGCRRRCRSGASATADEIAKLGVDPGEPGVVVRDRRRDPGGRRPGAGHRLRLSRPRGTRRPRPRARSRASFAVRRRASGR